VRYHVRVEEVWSNGRIPVRLLVSAPGHCMATLSGPEAMGLGAATVEAELHITYTRGEGRSRRHAPPGRDALPAGEGGRRRCVMVSPFRPPPAPSGQSVAPGQPPHADAGQGQRPVPLLLAAAVAQFPQPGAAPPCRKPVTRRINSFGSAGGHAKNADAQAARGPLIGGHSRPAEHAGLRAASRGLRPPLLTAVSPGTHQSIGIFSSVQRSAARHAKRGLSWEGSPT
jgi:hypothetical protein